MRVKVGDTWYDCQPDQPIMVELTDKDKFNIQHMAERATRYAVFDQKNAFNKQTMKEWMENGALHTGVHPGEVKVLDQ